MRTVAPSSPPPHPSSSHSSAASPTSSAAAPFTALTIGPHQQSADPQPFLPPSHSHSSHAHKGKKGRGVVAALSLRVQLLWQAVFRPAASLQSHRPASSPLPSPTSSSSASSSVSQPSTSCWNSWVFLLLLSHLLLLVVVLALHTQNATLHQQLQAVHAGTDSALSLHTGLLDRSSSVAEAESATDDSEDLVSAGEAEREASDSWPLLAPLLPRPHTAERPPFPKRNRGTSGEEQRKQAGERATTVQAPTPTVQPDEEGEAAENEERPAAEPSSPVDLSLSPSLPLSSLPLSSPSPLSWSWQVDSFAREHEIYTRLADAEWSRTPEIVRSFRRGLVDWHNLLPEYPHSGHGELDFTRLVATEQATTKFLTYDYNLHHYWRWGSEHGPMKEFAQCRKVNDKCNIHGKVDCLNNGLCGWCSRVSLCVDRFSKPLPYDVYDKKPACEPSELEVGPHNIDVKCDADAGATRFVSGRAQRVRGGDMQSQCSVLLSDRWLDTSLNPNAGSMFYHFISESLDGWYERHFTGGRIKDRYSHVIVTGGSIDHFHDYYGAFTRLCPRYGREVNEGACFCNKVLSTKGAAVHPVDGSGSLPPTSRLVDALVSNLGLAHIHPPRFRPTLGLLSRENKRFILNELELAREAVSMGVSIKLLPLEYMTVYEQIREFRRLHFLVGIHGSGLTNFFMLHKHPEAGQGRGQGWTLPPAPSTVETKEEEDARLSSAVTQREHYSNYCLQLMPYNVRIGGSGLRGFASRIGCHYEEWVQPHRNHTVPHPHFLAEGQHRVMDALLEQGPKREDSTFFSFWVNQDSIVDLKEWRAMLKRMIEA